jgi:hypothetical protein
MRRVEAPRTKLSLPQAEMSSHLATNQGLAQFIQLIETLQFIQFQ